MAKQKANIDKLYESVNKEYELGSIEQFKKDMQNPSLRKKLHETIAKDYNLPDFNVFSKEMGFVEKKNPNTPTASSGTANSTVSKPSPAFKTLDYGEVINKVREVDINERKAIKQAKATSIAVENTAPLLKALPKPIQAGAIDIGTGVTGLVGGLMEMAAKSPRWAALGGKADADKIMDYATSMQEASNSIMTTSKSESGIKDPGKSSFEHLTDGNLSDFGKSITRDFGRIIPQTVATAFSGGSTAVISTLGAVSAGNALTGEYAQDQDISMTDMAQSAAKGAAEVILSKVFNMDILAGNVIKKGIVSKLDDVLNTGGQVLKQKIKEEGKEAVLGQLIRSNKDVVIQGIKGGAQEVLEEDTNTLLSFVVDAIDEDKFNKESFDQLINDLGNTTLISMATGAPISLLAAKISQKPLTTDEKKTIESLNSILQNPDISNETRKIVQRKIADINKGINDESLNNLSKVANMSTEDKMSILFEQEQVSKLENDVKSITDVDLKDEMLAEIERRKQGVSDILNSYSNEAKQAKTETEEANVLVPKIPKVEVGSVGVGGKVELEKGNKIQWNVFGNEESGEWTVVEKTKTRGGKDAVVLIKTYVTGWEDGKSYTKEYADKNGIKYKDEHTVEHIVPLEDLQSIKEIPAQKQSGSVGVGGEETFYTGRGKKYDDLKNTKGEFIFFSKDPKISEWYGGDESNVSEAKLDTSDFLDLTTQESKSKFVKENFTDKDIEELYSAEIKHEEDRDIFGTKTREILIKKYRERAEENRFSGDGKEQQFLLKKIKEQGYSGVKLLDTHFGKSDISYVVIDKSKIKQSLKETPTPKGNTSNVVEGSVGVGGDVKINISNGVDLSKQDLKYGRNELKSEGGIDYGLQRVIEGKDKTSIGEGNRFKGKPDYVFQLAPNETTTSLSRTDGIEASTTIKTGISLTEVEQDAVNKAFKLPNKERTTDLENISKQIAKRLQQERIEQNEKSEAEQTVLDETPEGQLSSSGTPIEQNIETLPNEVEVVQEAQPEQITIEGETTPEATLKAQEAVKPETPEQAWTKSKVMMENQEQMLMDMNKKSSGWNNFVKKWFERQINVVKAMGNSKEAQKAKDQMTVVAGARSAADDKFKNSEKEIYKGLSLEEEKNLDHLLFHKRVVQIDSNYDTKGKDRIKHPLGFNKEDSEMAIEGLKKEIGEEKFNKLSEAADKYFQKQNEILQRLKEGELIDEDTYNRLKDDDYIKRVFIDHMNDNPENRSKALGEYGLKPKQIQALDEGSEGLLLMDSRQLLNAAYRSAEQRVFQNRANQALSDVIKIQPDMGKELKVWNNKNTGKPEFEHAQKGYTRVVYFVDGKPNAFQLKDNLYNEWMDTEKRTTELDSWVRTIMGTAVLKNMATGINATFAITNVPADYLNVIMATDTYDRTNVFNAAQKLARSFASNFAQLSLLNSTGVGSKNFKSLSDDFIKYGGGLEFLTTYGKPDDLVKRDKRYSMAGRAIRGTADTAVKALAFTGEQSERAMRLSVFNEVRNQAVKDAGGRDKITQKQWDDISYMAAAKARKTMDFAKGGLWSKKLDNVSPYFNASAQGTRVAAEYIYNNPKKFASKWAQISSAVAALTIYNAMVGDDEDWENIPDYEKNNYFIVFSPQKHINKKGEEVRGYWRWKKTPAMAPFLNLSEAGTMAAYNQMTGRSFGAKDETLKREWDAINDALPIPIDPTQLPNKMPPIPKAALSYFANYDFYRKQKLVTGVEEDILPQYQGLSDEKIPAIYKKIGEFSSKMSQDMAISPKKLQKATEMIITNPQTNTILGGAYGILDQMVNKFSDVPENWKNTDKEISTIFGGAKARIYREINPNYKLLQDNSLKKIEKELETKNVVIRNDIRDMIENEKPESDVKDFLKGKEGFSNEEKETLYKYYKNVKEDKKLQREIPSFYKLAPLKYWSKGSPEDKAKILAINVGIMDPKSEEFKDVLRDMDKMGISISDRFINGYQEIYRQTLENK